MREIEIYQLLPEFTVGDKENLIKLKAKLEIDNITLEKIEFDYSKEKEKFKEEYFAAKKNYLKNKRLYYWLLLKWYLDQAIFSEMSNTPDYQKEELKSKGWMFPLAFINTKITTSGGVDVTTEELYIRNFDRFFDKLFGFDIGEKDSRIDRYYKQAIFNYKNQCYYSCVVSLFPIIESYHQFLTDFNENEFYKIKDRLNDVNDKIDNVQQIYTVKISYYANLVKQFNNLAKNHYFNISLDRLEEPEIINRNRIMHGLFSREISQKDCLQLFCVISNMTVIKSILQTDDMLKSINNELNSLVN